MPAKKGARKPSEREVREQAQFDALRGVLEANGWSVTVSKSLDGRGGDCFVRGEPRVIVSRRLPMSDRLEVLCDAVARLELHEGDVPDLLRGLLGRPAGAASAGD